MKPEDLIELLRVAFPAANFRETRFIVPIMVGTKKIATAEVAVTSARTVQVRQVFLFASLEEFANLKVLIDLAGVRHTVLSEFGEHGDDLL